MLEIGHELQLGRYRIKERLNQGGMGAVYLATDRNLSERLVAIKENTETSPATQQQFQQEAVLLARLTHANLPRVTDHFIEPSGRQYLVMDYVGGDDLEQIIRQHKGPLPEAEVLAWLEQVMDALEYMHSWLDVDSGVPSPVIHRDIKPANIKRTRNGRIVLVDFGLAKVHAQEGTLAGARAVTPGYSPLEQYGEGTDVRSDIYALGATLYKLLTGEKPPDAPSLAAGTSLIPPRKRNPALSRLAERVILRAMQVLPANRFQSIQEMRTALAGSSFFGREHSTALTARNQSMHRADQPARRRRTGLWLWLIYLTILITFVIVAFNVLPTLLQRAAFITGRTDAPPATPTTPLNQATADGQAIQTPSLSVTQPGSNPPTATLPATLIPTPTAIAAAVRCRNDHIDCPANRNSHPCRYAQPYSDANSNNIANRYTNTAANGNRHTNVDAQSPATQQHASPTPTFTATWTPTLLPPTLTPTPTPLVAGATKTNPTDAAVYVYIPAGEFPMGNETETNEKPLHTVNTDDFWIMRTEVTNAQYARCMAAAVCTQPNNERWHDAAYVDHPVTNVDWVQATQYATWAGGRLPTEAEWEKAARGTDARLYPWGDQAADGQRLNYNFVQGDTTPVGQYADGASFYGVLDMAGNVEEWVADWYAADYYANSSDQNPPGPVAGSQRVVRGGSFTSNGFDVRATARGRAIPDVDYPGVGFRVLLPETV